ncbi:uncharacterized protein [Spinacia oleracea]|uniref:Uncharacterized protein isoform X1 n=1 Tax=Spinacia oleracea TaxID=3562 RepID=A0A9R0ISB1_SPIOL|nr:uncharacterized protein LOC110793658 isoform X1 [Spinacia oleracea]
MSLQLRIIACGNSVASFAAAMRFITGPAVMAASSIALGLRGTLLHVVIVQLIHTSYFLHWMLLVICVPSHTIYQFDSRRRDPLRSVLVKSLLNKVLMKMNVKKSALPQWKSVKCAQQEGGVECGYYVMKFMQDIFKSCKEVQDLEKVFTTPREGPFTKEELDEVRDKWTTYFNDCELPSV